jgi:uncharacterized protein
MDIERRVIAHEEARARKSEGKVVGTGVFYGSWSADLGGFRERFAPGAFADSLAQDDIRVQWQHSAMHVLGRVRAGTARVWEDERGMHYEVTPPDAQWARDAVASIERGDVDQNSFAFFVEDPTDQVWEEKEGTVYRTVLRARLREVGPQTDPAYPDTTVALRSMPRVMPEVSREALALAQIRSVRRSVRR